ncbi:MAG: hypothetical protein KAV87_53385 [Desulfobacteraceae bacterium]|nr:hypothetical protein [Desulfobacteraceae bacterium]
MLDLLQAQQRNINQLSLTAQNTITDTYRLKSYVIQLQALLQKIRALDGLRKSREPRLSNMNDTEKKQYAQLQNQIATETQLLKATSEAMQDTVEQLKKSGDIEHHISGDLMRLKKEMNKTLKQAEQTLNGQ